MQRIYKSLLLFLTLLFSISFTSTLHATHALGGDLTFEYISGNDYLVRLKFYRDCGGVSAPTSGGVSITGCGVSASASLTLAKGPTNVSPLCPPDIPNSSCNGGSFLGVEEYVLEGMVTLATPCTDYTASWSLSARNDVITTITNPGGQNLYLEAKLDNTQTAGNSSPVFTNIPASLVCVGQNIGYNHGVTDPEGDSLVFSLVDCLEAANNAVNYATGFSGVNPLLSSTGVTIDAATGQINFVPSVVQVGVVCVKIEEYRNGVKIGEVTRDMQFAVANCQNNIPEISDIYVDGTSTGSYEYDACVDQSFCFDVNFNDQDNDIMNVAWNNGIPSGSFTVTYNSTNNPSATFCWTPALSDIGTHFFTVTTEDEACPVFGINTEVFKVNVSPTVGTVSAGPDQIICQGESATLSAATQIPGATYSWTPMTGLSNPTGQTTMASPLVTTTYVVSAALPGSSDCPAVDSITVTVRPAPVLSLTPMSYFVCGGGSAILTAISSPGATYEWFEGTTSLGVGTVSGNTTTITVTPSVTTTYSIVATGTNNCPSTLTSTIEVNNSPVAACSNIYVTPNGSGAGTISSPARLRDAIEMGACNGSVLKIAVGLYNTIEPFVIPSNITFEGGFDPTNWTKSSAAGGTVINRLSSGNDGIYGGPALITFIGNSSTNFRFQDITITTADGPDGTATLPAFSTYGMQLTGCSDYDIVRTQIKPGKAGNGTIGDASSLIALNGEKGANGSGGYIDDDNANINGARGGGGAGSSGGDRGWDGVWGCTQPAGRAAGCNGVSGTDAGDYWSGGGGGAGGGGANEARDGGIGGNGGGVPAIPGGAAIATNMSFGPPNTLGSCKSDNNWGGQESDCNGSLTRQSAESGACGTDGVPGANGIAGTQGSAGAFVSCYWLPGGQGTAGARGQGGQGGTGGGGGAGEGSFFCVDGTGSSGGGGGGGGEGGYGGEGGFGGGTAVGIVLIDNGTGGNVINSDVAVNSLLAGMGGQGGTGTTGGLGGDGGYGGDPNDGDEVGFGGHGGHGGNGGDGGNGGNGQDGITLTVHLCSGSALATSDIAFDLAAQPEILVANVNCTETDVDFTGPTNSAWNYGVGASPATATGTATVTEYLSTGRKDITFSGENYIGFHNIAFDGNTRPDITTTANQVGLDTFQLCAGDTASFATGLVASNYIWDFNNAIPGVFVGGGFQTISPQVFNNPSPQNQPYAITLATENECCGLSPKDTIWLYVSSGLNVNISGGGSACGGGPADSLKAIVVGGVGPYTYEWNTGANTQTIPVMGQGTYTVTVLDVSGCTGVELVVTGTSTQIIAIIDIDDVTCNGNTDGSIEVTATNGAPPYDYQWDAAAGNATTPVVSGLGTGIYMVTITDAAGCTDISTLLVEQESCDICGAANNDPGGICGVIASDPGGPLGPLDCDGDGVTNATECMPDNTNPNDACDYVQGSITLPVTADQSGCVTSCPDLSPVTKLVPGNISGVSSVSVVVKITEVNGEDTDQSSIFVRIPSDPRLIFVWIPGLTQVGFDPVQNSAWNYLGDNGVIHRWEYNGPGLVIPASTSSSFGFNAMYDPQGTNGQTTITATIVPFSGGECVFGNNTDSERLVYFN